MIDKFLPALKDIREAVAAGEELACAVQEAAAEHRLSVHALLNRAQREIGDVETWRKQREEFAAHKRLGERRLRYNAIFERVKKGEHISSEECDFIWCWQMEPAEFAAYRAEKNAKNPPLTYTLDPNKKLGEPTWPDEVD